MAPDANEVEVYQTDQQRRRSSSSSHMVERSSIGEANGERKLSGSGGIDGALTSVRSFFKSLGPSKQPKGDLLPGGGHRKSADAAEPSVAATELSGDRDHLLPLSSSSPPSHLHPQLSYGTFVRSSVQVAEGTSLNFNGCGTRGETLCRRSGGREGSTGSLATLNGAADEIELPALPSSRGRPSRSTEV